MIREQSVFMRGFDRINRVFGVNKRMPEKVFRENYSGFVFADIEWAMSADFWSSVQKLSKKENEGILIAVLEPDPIEYFYREFGEYNMFQLPCNASSDEYWNALEVGPADSPADAILYNSDVIVWVPESLGWAIWAQRELGVCVLAFNDSTCSRRASLSKEWMNADELLSKFLPSIFQEGDVPSDLAATLRNNYS